MENVDDQGCCGHPTRKRAVNQPALPANPAIGDGESLLFMGSGRMELTQNPSGLRYIVAEHRRKFVADKRDVDGLLTLRRIIRAPSG